VKSQKVERTANKLRKNMQNIRRRRVSPKAREVG